MSKNLVIVESAGKIKKISEYLGSDYIVKASFGHCMDLDPKTLSIDVENNYKPHYIISDGKNKIVKELKELSKTVKTVILAADNDREGEAIAWSLANLLDLKNPPRIIFTEITKKAIQSAIENPTQINMNMVYAQQGRRLLDRLVGYKISPILQKNLNDRDAKSAGRVQSVVVKIIMDKEEEINKSTTLSYLKSSIELDFNNNKINAVLMLNDEIYKIDNIEIAKNLLKQINKNTEFKVTNIENKLSTRKPSPPYITSSLQQDASTKLKFNVKKTMEVAQKLYEGGHITYMRTDSPNLSQDAINDCKKYIIDKYGENYSNPKNYSSSNNAQEAHEAIRPSNIKNNELKIDDIDQIKLYNLIWKRTVASQMSPAKVNIQIISIDTLNDNKSILDKKRWVSIYESIIYDGFLVVYGIENDEECSEENQIGKIEIKLNDLLTLIKIKICDEYNKLPLRFNEANLVRFLEKNNIGRPSTYASIINKIIERKYVQIKDIDGIKKESRIIELDKKFKIKETIKNILIGKENKKIVPTDLGIKVGTFLQNNFTDIMKIDFTAEFEKYLDKIADGKAVWYNVLDIFYKKFNPIVEELSKTIQIKNNDRLLGINPNNNKELFVGKGKYGPFIKYLDDNDSNKYKYVSIDTEDIELEEAVEIVKYPLLLGKYNKKNIELVNGKYGLYIKYNNNNYSLGEIPPVCFSDPHENLDVSLNEAISIIKSRENKEFKVNNLKIIIKNGKYGNYLEVNGKNKQNIPIPKNIDIEKIDLKKILEIISNKKYLN